jgi:uncharacterized cupredoxin-like copper-binding protein
MSPKMPLLTLGAVVLASGVASAAGAERHAGQATTVAVTEGKPAEFKITLSKTSVPRGVVTFQVTNSGALGHDFKVCSKPAAGTPNTCTGKGTAVIGHGKKATLRVVFLRKGTYGYLCTVAGHAAAGMKGSLKVT